jgi:MFS family permease
VAAGFGAYRSVLSDPRARAFSLAGFVARLPLSMTALGIVLLVSATTGSYARAGIITAVATVAGAVAAPVWGRMIDRVGQARVLVVAGLVCNLSLTLLVVTVLLRLPLAITLLTAVGVGLGFSSAGSAVRARWAHRLRGNPLLNTAYALEAVVDEVVFMVGPVLVTFLATAVHPALGLASCVFFGLIGALALASMRDTQPPTHTAAEAAAAKTPLSVWLLVPVVLACGALGALFGGMELVVVAFAQEAGIPQYTGLIVMAWAFGSLIAGLLTGTVAWKASPARRFRIGALLLGCSVLPLPFADHPVLVTVLLTLSGFFIAPTLIASVAVTQAAVPSTRLTEALGWTSTGMAGGVAAGAASLGYVIDLFGSRAGFWGVVVIGGLLIAAAMCVRTARGPLPSGGVEPDVTQPTGAQPTGAGPVAVNPGVDGQTGRLRDLERS